MGFEALSRGAESVVLVENSLPAYKALLENKELLKANNAQLFYMDALQFLTRNRQLFDIIFLDPPYNQGWLPKLLPQLRQHLAPEGLLYAEAEFPIKDEEGWQVIKHGKAGNVYYHLLKSL
jgi:16S rRNA (guanine(966)-N(2))-methyltransferase RsmD